MLFPSRDTGRRVEALGTALAPCHCPRTWEERGSEYRHCSLPGVLGHQMCAWGQLTTQALPTGMPRPGALGLALPF